MSISNIRHVRAFVTVAHMRHFTKAADAVGLSQSALSMSIRQLEEELGAKLLYRRTRSVELTPIGAEFLKKAESVLVSFDEAIEHVRDYRDLRKGKVTIAALPSLASSILPSILSTFSEMHPDIALSIFDAPGAEIVDSLRTRFVDLALTFEEPAPDLETTPLFKDHLVLYGSASRARISRKGIDWRKLRDEPIIAMAPGTTIRTLTDIAAARAGIAMNIVYEPRMMSTAISMAKAGLGCAILPSARGQIGVDGKVEQHSLINPVVERQVSIVRLKQYPLSPAAEEFYKVLENSLLQPDG